MEKDRRTVRESSRTAEIASEAQSNTADGKEAGTHSSGIGSGQCQREGGYRSMWHCKWRFQDLQGGFCAADMARG